jgi:hypothetical protein
MDIFLLAAIKKDLEHLQKEVYELKTVQNLILEHLELFKTYTESKRIILEAT